MKRTVFHYFVAALTICATSVPASAQDETSEKLAAQSEDLPGTYCLVTNVDARKHINLSGDWNAVVDQYDNGFYNYRMKMHKESSTYFADRHYYGEPTKLIEYDFDRSPVMKVPGDWNTQNSKLYYYEGSIWYRKLFDLKPCEGKRYFAHFGAVNYEAVCALNGKILGKHTGGFTPFDFEITSLVKEGSNSLIVKANNSRHKDGVPTSNCDWWNYGGITREVRILELPETFIRDYCIRLSSDGKCIEGWVQLDGSSACGGKVDVNIPELGKRIPLTADASGKASFSIPAKPELWSPESPKLYDIELSHDTETVTDRIGFRTIRTEGSEMLLNGKSVFCTGIAIHEETMDQRAGRAWSREQSLKLLTAAKSLGCNFVRLAHYPHNENMTRLADSLGIMVWSEIPAYWTISWTNKDTYNNAANQLEEMIARDRNRACIIIWSVANETPVSEERTAFLSRLIDRARELDGTRLVSAALEKKALGNKTYTVNDPLLEKTDLISFNQYIGWYDGHPDKCLKAKWVFPMDKPVIVTELGAGVKKGYHADRDVMFSEEYGVELYKAQISMLSRMPQLAGVSPWILKDFRSPRRQLYGIQDDFNRKGLVSETGERKDVYYVMQGWYSSLGRTITVKGNKGSDIQKAIDKAFAAGGGRVLVPEGIYNVGSIRLKSNVELHLEKGAVLLGSDKVKSYDDFPESVCSIKPEMSGKVLLYAFDSQNIAITGEGTVDGRGPAFFNTAELEKGFYAKPSVERPRMLQFVNCDGIRLSGVTFKDSPCWTMLLRLCRNIYIDGITITADQRMINNDGIDFDACRHVRVKDSKFRTGDDCIILRAMKETQDQHVVCEDVFVSDCILDSRCQAIRLGCPSDDTIRKATFKNITATGNNGIFADFPVRYLSDGDKGSVDLSDIVFDNFSGEFQGSALQIVSEPGVRTRKVDRLVFRNFNVKSDYKLRFIGNPGSEIGNVLLENFNAVISKSSNPLKIKACNGLIFKNVTINGQLHPDGPVAETYQPAPLREN